MNFRNWHDSSTPISTTLPLHRKLRETGIQGSERHFCPIIWVKVAYLIYIIIYIISPGEAHKLNKSMLHSYFLKVDSSILCFFLLFNNLLGPLLILGFSGVFCSGFSGNPSDDIFFQIRFFVPKMSKRQNTVALRH